MKSVKLTGGGRGKQPTVSTSKARANFASALQTVAKKKTIIGFDRYKETVAVLAPIEVVFVLAGRAREVDREVLETLERMSRLFLHRYPAPKAAASPPRLVRAAAKKAKKAPSRVGRPRLSSRN